MNLLSRRGRLLDFHRPNELGVEHPLKPESITCLRNLSAYKRPPARGRYPRSRSAAVLVALFVGRGGDLYALLSRRSDRLRSYPGDTSLPGGKLERIDRSIENAARREAFEEIGMPLDKTKVPLLCIMEPFLAGNHTIVTPVVVLVTDPTIRPILNENEVQSIFSHPLISFIMASPLREPEPHPQGVNTVDEPKKRQHVASTPLTPPPTPGGPSEYSTEVFGHSQFTASTYALKPPEKPYHTYWDMAWHGNTVRMHRFLTGRETEGVKPISGMTAAILIRTAQIGYAREPEFELYALGQQSLEERMATAMRVEESLRKACLEEGIERDWTLKEERRDEKRHNQAKGQKRREDKGRAKL